MMCIFSFQRAVSISILVLNTHMVQVSVLSLVKSVTVTTGISIAPLKIQSETALSSIVQSASRYYRKGSAAKFAKMRIFARLVNMNVTKIWLFVSMDYKIILVTVKTASRETESIVKV